MSARRHLVIAFLCAGLLLPGAGQVLRAGAVFPGAAWEFRSPAQVGMDAAQLDRFAGNVGGVGCVVRNGYMVKTWGSQSAKADWASASKPVVTTLMFFALKEGRLSSVDALIRDFGWSLNVKDQAMTFRHLANMISGYSRSEDPGAAWAYNDYGIQLYVKTLFDRVYGTSNANAVAIDPARLGYLQLEDGALFGSRGGYGVSTSVRDFARIGWFWANKGNWNGTQLLPQSCFDDYMRPYVPASLPRTCPSCLTSDYLGVGSYGGGTDQTQYGPGIYGFAWWFNAMGGVHPASLTWPDAPRDTFQANGHFDGEVVTVIPSLRLVASARGNWGSFQPGNPAAGMNQNLKLLAQAVLPEAPLIQLDPTAMVRSVEYTQNLTDDTFSLTNGGPGTLKYTITCNQTWLTVGPATGSASTEEDTITVSYCVSSLPVGTHVAMIEVLDNASSPPALNSPQAVTVTVTVKTVLPDFNLDGDVDQEDFGFMQTCFTGAGGAMLPGCEPADITGDEVIDGADLSVLRACMSGAGMLADRACDDAFE